VLKLIGGKFLQNDYKKIAELKTEKKSTVIVVGDLSHPFRV
jgi:hypothetical protein